MSFYTPELSLKMTLAEFGSADPQRVLIAINVAATYEISTPGIAEALKSATQTGDPEIMRHAKLSMRQLVDKQKAKTGGVVRIPNEPSYRGKLLGEWLAMKQAGSGLTTNAVDALRQMGTNAIPALLNRLTYNDPVFGLIDSEVSMGAVIGFMTMGDKAKPALPALGALIDADDPDLGLWAMIAILGMGADAVPFVIKGLTNRFPQIRSEAAHFLAEWGAKFPNERKQAQPQLLKLLNDPNRDVRLNAAEAIKQIDPATAGNASLNQNVTR